MFAAAGLPAPSSSTRWSATRCPARRWPLWHGC